MLSETVTIIRLINWPQAEGIITCYTRFGIALEFFLFHSVITSCNVFAFVTDTAPMLKSTWTPIPKCLANSYDWVATMQPLGPYLFPLYFTVHIYIYIMLYRLYVTECHGRVSAPRMTWHFACALVYTTDRFQAQCKTQWFLVLKKRSQISVSVRIYSCDVLSVITGFNLSGPLNL